MNAIITKDGNTFHMSVIYDKTTHTYFLVFASTKNNHGEQYTCKSYADAVNKFVSNCRFYGLHQIPRVPLTEEEFLGIEPGALWPRSNSRATRKEVQPCRA